MRETPPNTDESDGDDFAPLPRLGSLPDTDVVLALLRSEGIPAIPASRHNPRSFGNRNRILVPRSRWQEAIRLMEEARDDAPAAVSEPIEEPRSVFTAITWILALGIAAVALLTLAGTLEDVFQRWLR